MQTKPTERAMGPNDRVTPGLTPRSEARIRPDHAAHHGRSTPRDAATRRGKAQSEGSTSMDYQQGFFSGPTG
jgi:hypothetical protein